MSSRPRPELAFGLSSTLPARPPEPSSPCVLHVLARLARTDHGKVPRELIPFVSCRASNKFRESYGEVVLSLPNRGGYQLVRLEIALTHFSPPMKISRTG